MRRAIGPGLRFKVLDKCRFRCHYCGVGARAAVLEIDHILAVANGGTNAISNLVAACFACNRGKSALRLADTTTFSTWLRLQCGRDDLVGDVADDEERMPLGDIRTYAELRGALRYVGACYEARVAAVHAWREYKRGMPTALVREQQEGHQRRKALRTEKGSMYWSKEGVFVRGKKL